MASNRFTGYALPVAQVDTRTIAVVSIGSTFSVTRGDKVFTYTATTVTAATEAAAFVLAFAALDSTLYPEFAEVTAVVSTGASITFTSNTPGKPFTFTYAAGGTGSPTFNGSTTTANAGPKVWSTPANWSLGVAPVATNDIYLDGVFEILYDLDTTAVGTFNSLTVELQNGSKLGLHDINSDGGANYAEYRQKELKINATTVTIRSGAQRLRIDNAAVQTTVNCFSTGTPEDNLGWEALTWKGTHASNVFNAAGGSIGIAVRDGELATVATLNVTQSNGQTALRCGPSTTLTTVKVVDGTVTIPAGATTVTQEAGSLTITGAANVTTLTVEGGSVFPNFAGTIATLSLTGTLDTTGDVRALTVTNATVYKGATFTDPGKRVTFSNAVTRKCFVSELTWNHGASGTILTA